LSLEYDNLTSSTFKLVTTGEETKLDGVPVKGHHVKGAEEFVKRFCFVVFGPVIIGNPLYVLKDISGLFLITILLVRLPIIKSVERPVGVLSDL
jgi:hypothetical protein